MKPVHLPLPDRILKSMNPPSPATASDLASVLQVLLSQQQEDRGRYQEEKRQEDARREELRRQDDLQRTELIQKHEADMMAMRLEMVRFQRQAEEDKKWERAQNQEEHAKREMELNETLERKRLAEEEEKARTRADAAKRHLKRDLHPLTAKDRPSTYMACFERLAREHAVPKESWAGCFLTCLTGDHLAMWASYVEAHDTTDYDAIKSYFLNRVGLNWETRSKYISCPKKPFNLN